VEGPKSEFLLTSHHICWSSTRVWTGLPVLVFPDINVAINSYCGFRVVRHFREAGKIPVFRNTLVYYPGTLAPLCQISWSPNQKATVKIFSPLKVRNL
jgi:hypothetical protein